MIIKAKKTTQKLIQKCQLILSIAFLLLLPLLTYAQGTQNPGPGGTQNPGAGGTQNPGGLTNPLSVDSLRKFLDLILDVIVQIGFPLVVLAVIWTGFLFVKAQGNEQKLSEAKEAFIWTVVGALVVLGAFAIGQFICGTVEEIGANVEC